MPTNCFWNLRFPESTRKLAEWDHDVMELEQVICPNDSGHQRGGKRLTDLSVTLPRGIVDDFVWTWQSECLIQDRVLGLFRTEGFTGFDVKPVKARFKSCQDEPPTLRELVVTGWAGLARPESGIKRVQYCEACKHVRYSGITDARQLIDETQWDGSDFFIVWPMPKFLFVTQRVADCIRDQWLSGAVLTRVHDLSLGTDGFGPGRLSYRMPEARARELGKAAGIAEI
jgi:hypothetical protein